MSLREIDNLCPNLPLFLIFFLMRGLGETMLAEASVLDAIAGKRVIGISSLAISVSSSGLMLLSEKIIFNKHWVHPVLYGPDLQFLPFSGHGHFGASAILSCHISGKFGMKKALLESRKSQKRLALAAAYFLVNAATQLLRKESLIGETFSTTSFAWFGTQNERRW